MDKVSADQQAVEVAQALHRMAGASQTILFGSRARGDHRSDSDLDILVLKQVAPSEEWLETLQSQARVLLKQHIPEASGIDILCMTSGEFRKSSRLKNHLANTIAKQGVPILPDENVGDGADDADEQIDWEDVETKVRDSTGAVNWLLAIRDAGILDAGDDKQFGRVAQNALEFAYKAVLGSHGCEYPTSGRDGHNLRILANLLRENSIIAAADEAPGENHRYLTEFGGAALYTHEHPALDRQQIAEDIPIAVAELTAMVEDARDN